jgi:hypothetical protein
MTQLTGADIPRIKGLPGGWNPLFFQECQCGHDHDAVVLCERTREDGDHGTRYVTWWVNMDLGGCFNGHYADELEEAMIVYSKRRERLQ